MASIQASEGSDTKHVPPWLGQNVETAELPPKTLDESQFCDPSRRFTFEVKCHQVFLGSVELKLHDFVISFRFNKNTKIGSLDHCVDIGCYQFGSSDEKMVLSLSNRVIERFGFCMGDRNRYPILLFRCKEKAGYSMMKRLNIEEQQFPALSNGNASQEVKSSRKHFRVVVAVLKPFDDSCPDRIIRKNMNYTKINESQLVPGSYMQEAINTWLMSVRGDALKKPNVPNMSKLQWPQMKMILNDLHLIYASSIRGQKFLCSSFEKLDPPNSKENSGVNLIPHAQASTGTELGKIFDDSISQDDLKQLLHEWDISLDDTMVALQPPPFSSRFIHQPDSAFDLGPEEELRVSLGEKIKKSIGERRNMICSRQLPKRNGVTEADGYISSKSDQNSLHEFAVRSANVSSNIYLDSAKQTVVLAKRRKVECVETVNMIEEESQSNTSIVLDSTPSSSSSSACPSIFAPNSSLLTYPGGRGSITISFSDMRVLAYNEMLNDTVLEFYMKYIIHEKLNAETSKNVYCFNTFFFSTLLEGLPVTSFNKTPRAASIRFNCVGKNYEKVKRWTRKDDIFSKEFVVIPVHTDIHWSVIIIVRPGLAISEEDIPAKFVTSHRKKGAIDPEMRKYRSFIFVLDSLIDPQNKKYDTFVDIVKDYLEYELEDKKQLSRRLDRLALCAVMPARLPRQTNYVDCGFYTASFVETFLCDPPNFEEVTPSFDWSSKYPFFETVTMKFMRDKMVLAIKNRTTKQNWNQLQAYECQVGKGATINNTESLINRARHPRRHSSTFLDIDRHLVQRCSSEPPNIRTCPPPSAVYYSQNAQNPK